MRYLGALVAAIGLAVGLQAPSTAAPVSGSASSSCSAVANVGLWTNYRKLPTSPFWQKQDIRWVLLRCGTEWRVVRVVNPWTFAPRPWLA